MRDATRGGLSAAANEMGLGSGVTLVLDELAIPVSGPVRSACDLLGMNPLDMANEGKLLLAVSAKDADKVLSALRGHPLGKEAAVIGLAEKQGRFPAVLKTTLGSRAILEMPRGELLPRIC
jgi:hydrogenase expression/formation protein HypE